MEVFPIQQNDVMELLDLDIQHAFFALRRLKALPAQLYLPQERARGNQRAVEALVAEEQYGKIAL